VRVNRGRNASREKVALYALFVTRDCTMCKGGEHLGDCPKDSAILEVLELAKKEGWKRCSKCNRVIELKHGCNHIKCVILLFPEEFDRKLIFCRCKCKAEWCYVCGAKWKTCACEQ
jgi:hypothetical protein